MAVKLRPRGMTSPYGLIQSQGTLARVPLAGGAPRLVLENVFEADWSPDGQELAVVRSVGHKRRLEFPLGRLLYEAAWIEHPRVSPRGDLVAFMEQTEEGKSSLSIADRAGRRTVLVPVAWHGLSWSPGGEEIWFSAGRRFEGQSLWAVDLEGRQRLLARFPGGSSLQDISRDGRLLVRFLDYQRGIVGSSPGETRERDLSWLDSSRARDLSPDGHLLLFHETGHGGGPSFAVYLRTMDGASPPVRLGEGWSASLSPDSRWALTFRTEAPSELHVLPTGPGEAKVLKGSNLVFFSSEGNAPWFPDGQSILVPARTPGEPDRSFVLHLDGSAPRPVTPEGIVASAVSQDGRLVAALDPDRRIVLYAVDGGEAQIVAGPPEPGELGRFTAGGRSLYVYEFDGRVARVFLRDLTSGRRTPWRTLSPSDPAGIWRVEPIFTPDLKSYVYTWHRDLSTLYLVEGLK